MRKYALYFIIAFAIISCGKDDSIFKPDDPTGGTPPSTLEAVTYKDVSYGNNAQQKMDIYLPARRTTANTKVLVLLHGGAWVEGDKSDADFAPVVDTLKKRLPDWAIININYRLATLEGLSVKNLFPAQEDDVKTALELVYNKRADYAISDKWVLAGASAGAHLAMLQAYKNNTLVKPKAVINYFGPSDLNAMISNPSADSPPTFLLRLLFNGKEQASSPINFINSQTPATITFQGNDDKLVLPSQQTALHAKLKASSVPEQLEIFAGETHGFSGTTMSKSYDMVLQFLNAHVK